ncbi:OV39 antigen [Dirofilaria immitis]
MITSIILFLLSSSPYFFIDATSSSKHCGLPSFVRHLPEAENREVLSIWKEYKLGEDCTDERRETQEIIDNLPNDVRAMVFGRVPSFLTNASADVKKMFRTIIYNKTLNYDMKKQELSKLAEEILNKKQLAEFQQYLKERERRKKEFEEKVNNLSSAAKEVYEKLQHLKAERAKIMEEMTDDVRKELRRLFRKSKNHE